MTLSTALPVDCPQIESTTSLRRRLYGLGLIVALAFLHVAQLTNESSLWVNMYLPFAGATMLGLCFAGAELNLYLQRVAHERAHRQAELGRFESDALHRQRKFNQLWQELADHRGDSKVPDSVMENLQQLFATDLVVFWAANPYKGGYRLKGLHPLEAPTLSRLDKIGQVSPCFERLRADRTLVRHDDFARQTTPALSWFCEENKLEHVILAPVLVRSELVGVVAFFYRERLAINSRIAEEMQSAANLFLCAL